MIWNCLLNFLRVVAIGALMTCAAGCSTRGGSIPYDVKNFGVPDAPRAAVSVKDYKIASGDTLAITVFQAEALSHEYQVDVAGNLAMPLIGSVSVIGLTTDEAAKQLKDRLSLRYMQNPDVTVSVKESVNRNVTVEGSVRQPGVYPVVGPVTLVQAVALARGTDENANPKRVAIFRTVDGQRMAAAFDLISIRRGEAKDPDVYAGDIVVVDGTATRGLLRDVVATLPVLALFRPY